MTIYNEARTEAEQLGAVSLQIFDNWYHQCEAYAIQLMEVTKAMRVPKFRRLFINGQQRPATPPLV